MAAKRRGVTRRAALALAALAAAGVGGWWAVGRITARRPDHADQAYGEGARALLDIYLPEGTGPFPVVIEIHGGAFKTGSKSMSPPSAALLAAGFAIARPNYRLSGTDLWPAQLEDCLAATRFVLDRARQYGLDPDRFALWGQSAGSFLAVSVALSLAEAGRPPGAVIGFYGPMDFSTMDADMAALGRSAAMGATGAPESAESQLLGFAVGEGPDAARAMGPVGRLGQMAPQALPPLFLRHGDADPLIAHGQSERLAAAWAGVDPSAEIDFALVPGAGHGGDAFDGPVVMDPMLAFLGRHLGRPG